MNVGTYSSISANNAELCLLFYDRQRRGSLEEACDIRRHHENKPSKVIKAWLDTHLVS